jgi:membrane protease YdiL (CAAX protease family)
MDFDPHRPHALLIYAAVMAFYTFAVFLIPFGRDGASFLDFPLYSDRRIKGLSAVILIHIGFLAVLTMSMLFSYYVCPLLPNWLTEEWFVGSNGIPASTPGIMFGLFVMALAIGERAFIYLNSDAVDSDSDNDES